MLFIHGEQETGQHDGNHSHRRKNQYEQIEGRSMDLKCRLYRSKWIQSIAASDVMKSGQVVENPMIGAIPSRNEVQRELDDLLMSM